MMPLLKANGGNPGLCWSCAVQLQLPPRIRIGKNVVMLNYDTKLFPHHINDERLYDFTRPIAEVARHPSNETCGDLKQATKMGEHDGGRQSQRRRAGTQRYTKRRH
jgi:hypothetical protein